MKNIEKLKSEISPSLDIVLGLAIFIYMSVVSYIIFDGIELWNKSSSKENWNLDMYKDLGWLTSLLLLVLVTLMAVGQMLNALADQTHTWTMVQQLCKFHAELESPATSAKDLPVWTEYQRPTFVWTILGTEITVQSIKTSIWNFSTFIGGSVLIPALFFAFKDAVGI